MGWESMITHNVGASSWGSNDNEPVKTDANQKAGDAKGADKTAKVEAKGSAKGINDIQVVVNQNVVYKKRAFFDDLPKDDRTHVVGGWRQERHPQPQVQEQPQLKVSFAVADPMEALLREKATGGLEGDGGIFEKDVDVDVDVKADGGAEDLLQQLNAKQAKDVLKIVDDERTKIKTEKEENDTILKTFERWGDEKKVEEVNKQEEMMPQPRKPRDLTHENVDFNNIELGEKTIRFNPRQQLGEGDKYYIDLLKAKIVKSNHMATGGRETFYKWITFGIYSLIRYFYIQHELRQHLVGKTSLKQWACKNQESQKVDFNLSVYKPDDPKNVANEQYAGIGILKELADKGKKDGQAGVDALYTMETDSLKNKYNTKIKDDVRIVNDIQSGKFKINATNIKLYTHTSKSGKTVWGLKDKNPQTFHHAEEKGPNDANDQYKYNSLFDKEINNLECGEFYYVEARPKDEKSPIGLVVVRTGDDSFQFYSPRMGLETCNTKEIKKNLALQLDVNESMRFHQGKIKPTKEATDEFIEHYDDYKRSTNTAQFSMWNASKHNDVVFLSSPPENRLPKNSPRTERQSFSFAVLDYFAMNADNGAHEGITKTIAKNYTTFTGNYFPESPATCNFVEEVQTGKFKPKASNIELEFTTNENGEKLWTTQNPQHAQPWAHGKETHENILQNIFKDMAVGDFQYVYSFSDDDPHKSRGSVGMVIIKTGTDTYTISHPATGIMHSDSKRIASEVKDFLDVQPNATFHSGKVKPSVKTLQGIVEDTLAF